MLMQTYILATSKDWHIREFDARRKRLPGRWVVVVSEQDLETLVDMLAPRYVFFPHWSHIVPDGVLHATECVCFHMTDVPYGRGGSPLQNLIVRGHKQTMLTALRMEKVLDAGPVYMKQPLSLDGSARHIFQRAAVQALDMIETIVRNEPEPMPQTGTSTEFARRTPDQSLIGPSSDPEQLYDHIRMLDADGYPHAFIDHGHWRVGFTEARRLGDTIEARAQFTMKVRS